MEPWRSRGEGRPGWGAGREQERPTWLQRNALQLAMTALLALLSLLGSQVLSEVRQLTGDVRAVLLEQAAMRRDVESMRRDLDRNDRRITRIETPQGGAGGR